MRFDVRTPGGQKLGTADVVDPTALNSGSVRFLRRYAVFADQFDYADSVEMKVGTWKEKPVISPHGAYRPGRIDFVLVWAERADALFDVTEFDPDEWLARERLCARCRERR